MRDLEVESLTRVIHNFFGNYGVYMPMEFSGEKSLNPVLPVHLNLKEVDL